MKWFKLKQPLAQLTLLAQFLHLEDWTRQGITCMQTLYANFVVQEKLQELGFYWCTTLVIFSLFQKILELIWCCTLINTIVYNKNRSGHHHGGQIALVSLGLNVSALSTASWLFTLFNKSERNIRKWTKPDHGLWQFANKPEHSALLYAHRGTG